MNNWLCIAAINGALAVLCGAFAAHGLQGRLDAHALEIFQTGARYHMVHALAMGLAALSARPGARWAAGLFLAGILLFSGSLYALALTGVIGFAFVTPVGGMAFVGGWIALAFAARRTA
jgi:uncharacterized membrane protein YgdD (TMEM256/DUF423 family)